MRSTVLENVLGAVHLEKLLLYADVVRRYLDPNNSSPYFFVRHGGGQLTQLSNRIKAVGHRFGMTLPTATRVRKIGSTAAALECGMGDEARIIAQQMSHSAATHEKHYEALSGTSHAARAFETMERLHNAEKADKLSVRKEKAVRRRFTAEEEKEVREYFAPAIFAKITPSLEECQEFLQGMEMTRDKKQIQDKIKTL